MLKYLLAILTLALHQISFSSPEHNTKNERTVSIETQISGITVINGKLWIDGYSVTKDSPQFKSPASGVVYKIKWGSNNNISVEEKK